MSFASDMQKFSDKTVKNIDDVIGAVVIGVATEVIKLSPVGDASYWLSPAPAGYTGGRFRGNWDYGVTIAPNVEYDVIDKTGSISKERIKTKLVPNPSGKVHWIVNNLPYAQRLEDGYSTQAPSGMVRLTVIKFQSIVDKSVSKIR